MSYADTFGRDREGRYLFSVFCDRCLAAAGAAEDLPDGGTDAVVEVPLDFALLLHQTWVGEEQPKPRRAGDLVGWCQQARVIVAREHAVAGAQLELFGAAT